MKNKMKLSLIYLAICASQMCFAQSEVGHGGDSIVCYDRPLYKIKTIYVDHNGVLVPKEIKEIDKNAKITSASLKDYWEYGTTGYYNLNLGSQNPDYYERAKDVIERLNNVDPSRSEKLQQRLKTFKREFAFTNRAQIPEINDSNSVVIPREGNNCYDRQLAVQRKNVNVGERKILVDSVIFNQLPIDHQAGLVLHELLYEEAIAFFKGNLNNSDSVRYYNYLISSDFMAEKDVVEQYFKIIIDKKIVYSETDAVLNGTPVILSPTPNESVAILLKEERIYTIKNRILTLPARTTITFDNNGLLKTFTANSLSLQLGAFSYEINSAKGIDGNGELDQLRDHQDSNKIKLAVTKNNLPFASFDLISGGYGGEVIFEIKNTHISKMRAIKTTFTYEGNATSSVDLRIVSATENNFECIGCLYTAGYITFNQAQLPEEFEYFFGTLNILGKKISLKTSYDFELAYNSPRMSLFYQNIGTSQLAKLMLQGTGSRHYKPLFSSSGGGWNIDGWADDFKAELNF